MASAARCASLTMLPGTDPGYQDQPGLGGLVVREPDHLITGGESAGPGADLLDDTGEVAALPTTSALPQGR
jgi:hypothetical protein